MRLSGDQCTALVLILSPFTPHLSGLLCYSKNRRCDFNGTSHNVWVLKIVQLDYNCYLVEAAALM